MHGARRLQKLQRGQGGLHALAAAYEQLHAQRLLQCCNLAAYRRRVGLQVLCSGQYGTLFGNGDKTFDPVPGGGVQWVHSGVIRPGCGIELPRIFACLTAVLNCNYAMQQTDNSGGWNNPALVETLKNKSERDRFLADPTVNAFIEEQRALDDFIFGLVKTNSPELLALDCLKTASGRVSKSKVLAFLYQHAETKAMDLICSLAAKQGRFPVARVHDAVFFRSRLGPDFKHELEFKLHDATHNKYWHLSPKQLKRYEPVSIDAAHDELLHRQRIADEEKRAIDYFTA